MLKITILVLLAMVAVASANLCCTPDENKGPITKVTRNKVTPAPETTPQVPITQVLVWKVAKDEDQSLILDWKNGKGLDWKFVSMAYVRMEGITMKEVWAHKSLLFRYSSSLRSLGESLAALGNKNNSYMMNYPVSIIQTLVNLMYLHKVTINASDYDTIMGAAKSIKIDKWIGTFESNDESIVAEQK